MKILYKILGVIFFTIVLISACTSHDEPTRSESVENEYYTCPMHPNIVQNEPGECPICGMDLVKKENTTNDPKVRKIKYWVDPMDPDFISDKPGKSPMGMDLVPVYEEDNDNSSSNIISIDPVVVQNMGIRVEHAKMRSLTNQIRTIGKIESAEDKNYAVNLRFSGWIEKIWADKIGQKLDKGDKLFEIFSPELISTQEEYLNAVIINGRDSQIALSARKKLILWKVPETHLDNIISSGNALQNLVVRAPASGFIMHKTIQAGSKIKAGSDLYHIADLTTIWVKAEIYEYEIPFVRTGLKVEMTLTNLPGRIFSGEIDYIYPILNPKSRTQQIRIVIPNNDLDLKPGMFADVFINQQEVEEVLTIPVSAIINSGSEKIVFVSYEIGKYEPRTIITGLYDDKNGYIQVKSGLSDGDQIVLSGQFLLDSESQLREAVQKLLAEKLQVTSEKQMHDHENTGTYYTCPMHPNIVEEEPGDCPICGMDLIEKEL